MQYQYRISFRRSPRIDAAEEVIRLKKFWAIFEKKTAANPHAGKQLGSATATHQVTKVTQLRESTPTPGDVQTEGETRDGH